MNVSVLEAAREAHVGEQPLPEDAPASALVLATENCTEIFGGAQKAAQEFNVTCLEHAPILTHQVGNSRSSLSL